MPHRIWLNDKQYALIPRVSDLVSVYSCQMTAVLNPIHTKQHVDRIESNMYALRGTIVHHRIENEIRKMIGMKEEPLGLSSVDKILYKRVVKNKYFEKEMNDYVELCMLNFYDFMNKYAVNPIYPEKELVYIEMKNGKIDIFNSLKGTVDLIAEVETENGMETVLIDWKSSTSFKEEYKIQLQAYDWLFHKTGTYEEMKKNKVIRYPMSKWTYKNGRYDVHRSLLVVLGKETNFEAYWVEVEDKTDFFRCQKAFKKPKRTFKGLKSYSKNISLKLHCMVCSYRRLCPFYEEGEMDYISKYE